MRAALLAVLMLATLAVASSHVAQAYYVSGDDLLRMCSGSVNEQSQCFGYLQGSLDMLEIKLVHSGYATCPPPGTRIDDVRDAVIRYLKKSPIEIRRLTAPVLVGSAINATWKCSKKQVSN